VLVQAPAREFVPGGSLHVGRHIYPFPVPPELKAIHASDSARHTDKIVKFERINHWYLSEQRCPAGYAICRDVPGCMPEAIDLEAFRLNVTHLDPIM
jgi:hypothetical protein